MNHPWNIAMSVCWRYGRRGAFQYIPDKNRFDPPELITPGVLFVKQAGWDIKAEGAPRNPSPIPNGAKVDLVMTHGPPYSHLDPVKGAKGEGCPHLLVAVERASPQLHAFGRTLEVSRAHSPALVRSPDADPFPRGGAPRS
jgi:hypothetical protein